MSICSPTGRGGDGVDLGLDGRVAVVTGGGGAIGAACVRLLWREGCRVVVNDVSAEAVDTLVAAAPEPCRGVVADVSVPEDAARVVGAALEAFGRLDVL